MSLIKQLIKDWRRFAKYLVAGGSATVVDFAVLAVLVTWAGMGNYPWYVLAATLSFLTATGVNFSISWNWVFADRHSRMNRQFWRFFAVTVVGISINNIVIVLLVEQFHLAILLSKVVATGLVVLFNFGANNWWAFKSDAPSEQM